MYGVTQGSVLGPIRFTIYTTLLGRLFRSRNMNYQLYSDDSHTCVGFVTYLGVYLDSTMSMTKHVTRVCGIAYGRLRNIARVRSSLPLLACKTLVHALVTSTLDFGNAALFGITGTLLHRLEMVQRAAARVVLCIDRRTNHSGGPSKHDVGPPPTSLVTHTTENPVQGVDVDARCRA